MAPKLADQIVSTHDVVKSESDRMHYRGLTLKNGLRVLVVSDPTTDKSAAALAVQVGCLSDPRNIPGIAHFCEHMLFLGTKKYPGENHYMSFLSNHGGNSNAFTALDHTCYFYDVMPENFIEANDIFAQFFIEPLFTESGTDRELLAVDNEHRKNLKSDSWRMWRLQGATGNPEHDFSKFGTGSKETLQEIPKRDNIDLRQALLDFHSKYYSSNIMRLCVLGKESLDELSDMAVELFGAVENKNVEAPTWPIHPFGEGHTKKLMKMVPIEDSRQMIVVFPEPDIRKDYRAGPGHYVSHLVCHEGEGSLLSFLKSKGWVTSLSGEVEAGGRGFSFLCLTMNLSTEGLDHSDDIVEALFQYLEMLRQQGPQEWIFEEIRNTRRTDFRFRNKDNPIDYVVALTDSMQYSSWEDTLTAPHLVEEYKPELIKDFMSHLIPEKIRISLVSRTFEGKTDTTEKYYGTEYSMEDIPEAKIQAWKNVGLNDKFHLPPVNEFIPTNFDLAPEEPAYTTEPKLLLDESGNRLWFMQDKEFKLPKGLAIFELRNPLLNEAPLNTCLLTVAVNCFTDQTKEYFYPASLAGLQFEIKFSCQGLKIQMQGYNQREQALIERVCEKLSSLKIDPKRFENLREAHLRKLKNYRAEQPYTHADYYAKVVLAEKVWTFEEQLAAMGDCTLKNCEEFLTKFLKSASLESLVYGNLRSQEAVEMQNAIRRILKFDVIPLEKTDNIREHKLNDGKIYEYTTSNDVHPNNSVMTYYQIGSLDTKNIRTIALNDLLGQILAEPCFDVLRTQEQLGYIVFGKPRRFRGTIGLRVIVQSDKCSTHLVERIQIFVNDHMKRCLTNMSPEEFEEHKKALISLKLEKPKKLPEKFTQMWSEVSDRTYVYDRKRLEADEIAKLTKDDVFDFFNRHIAHGAPALKQLIVKIDSTSNPGEKTECVKADYSIEDIGKFKSTHTYIERPSPRATK